MRGQICEVHAIYGRRQTPSTRPFMGDIARSLLVGRLKSSGSNRGATVRRSHPRSSARKSWPILECDPLYSLIQTTSGTDGRFPQTLHEVHGTGRMKLSSWLRVVVSGGAILFLLSRQSPAVVRAHAEISQLTPTTRATVAATRSGNWSDPGIWDAGPPRRFARIWIPEGMTVTIDGELDELYEWVRVDGILRFAPDTNTSLAVETLAIEHTGRLEIGTEAAPVTARAVLTFQHRGDDIDHVYDPIELSRGLVSVGTVVMHGQPKTSWVNVYQVPQVGAMWLEVGRVPGDWAPGDVVVLTASSYGDNETFQIVSIDETGIRLDRPISNVRAFPVNPTTGQPYAGLSLHLANLSRNVVVRTHPDHAGQIRQQGHVMLMHRGGHSIKYVEFENLGRT